MTHKRSNRNVVTDAAQRILDEMIRSNLPAGFATLEDSATGQSSGVVLVCLGPENVEAAIRFVHSLGNFHTVPVERGEGSE